MARRSSRRRYSDLVVGISAIAIMLVAFIVAMIAVNANGSHTNKANTAATASPTATETTSPMPSEGPTDTASPTPSGSTATATAAAPLPTGNGSGCDVGAAFQAQLRSNPVTVDQGAQFTGTVCLQKGQSIWAFNYHNGLYVMATTVSGPVTPIVRNSGAWNWTDRITDSTTVVFILANSQESDWVTGQSPNSSYGNRVVINDANIGKAGKVVNRVPVAVMMQV